ncbi:MAG: Do family serine endopeptidase [Alphaproteobacteria bacterium]|nr:Do family serine endopeptidase [Alphaproteobacteria bacterium]MDE2042986.1 Do family serine endopeptidase [Alphaproteobacteria bacterium]MDE2340885.1 Do family serine endopeptidase [Alphaproteobacteria bacterium]
MRPAYLITIALAATASIATLAHQALPTAALYGASDPSTTNHPITYESPRAGAPASFADLVEKLQPAVVNISTKEKVQVQQTNPFAGTPFGDLFGQQFGNGGPRTQEATGLGSGFIISSDGYIVTNNHVVAARNENGVKAVVSSITVIMPNHKEYAARLVGRDPASDLAVLKIDAQNLPYVRFGDSSRSRVGDWVIAIGEPLGLRGTVTAGIISAFHRNIGAGPTDNFIQTDAAINQGNSGGPLFNMNGEVIGINSIITSTNGGNVGLGFAIPSETAAPIIAKLKGGAPITRGYLGVQVQALDDSLADSLGVDKGHGNLVASVVQNGAAAKAGVRQGDVITRVNNEDVTEDRSLSGIVASLPVGAHVPIDVIRKGQHMTLTAVLEQRPSEDRLAMLNSSGSEGLGSDDGSNGGQSAAGKPILGMTLQKLTPDIAQQLGVPATTSGVVIIGINDSSDAATRGLQRGDIILQANQSSVSSVEEVRNAVSAAQAQGRANVLLLVQRGNRPAQFVAVKIAG